jgi:hypothetical protein
MSHFRHLFVPHQSNNQRAKLIHPSSLSLIIGIFAIFQIAVSQFAAKYPFILGYASQIPVSEIVVLSNQERLSHGLTSLTLDDKLSQAAAKKAADMFAKNYWAHVSPTGTQPWFFITESGYSYRYAGENLARDFSDPNSVVQAWMNSPTHRDNLLNSRYQNIGVAVVDGVLEGRETTLVVQMFGTKLSSAPAVSGTSASISVKAKEPEKVVALAQAVNPTVVPTLAPTPLPEEKIPVSSAYLASVSNPVSPYDLTRYISLGLLLLLSAVLVIDIIVVNRRKIVRWTSRSLAHLIFILILAIAAGSILRGQIL